jgi:ABC-2 type transport system permease protein
MLGVSVLLGAAFGALSNGFALLMRTEESLIGAVQFLLLPLTFLSSAFLAANLIPHGIRVISDFNPLNWAVVAGRAATSSAIDWGAVGFRAGFLAALTALCMAFATRAFRAYQRSV